MNTAIPLFRHLPDALATLLPNVERFAVPDGVHAMHEDNPAAFNVAVSEFIEEHRRAA